MPKYFSGEKPLPYNLLTIKAACITPKIIEDAFAQHDTISISIIHDGLHENSLGYIVHVKKIEGGFLISNIAGENELGVTNMSSLCTVLEHVSAQKYSKEVQKIFQKNRNNIGASYNSEPLCISSE